MKHFPKNLPAWLLALSLLTLPVLLLTGCSKTEESPPQPAAEETKVQTASPRSEVPVQSPDEPKVDDSVIPISEPAPVQNQPVDVPDPSGQ